MASSRLDLDKNGKEYKAKCCFHDEKTASLTFYTDETGMWLFKCMGCHKAGNIFQFLMHTDSISFGDAVEKVAEFAGWRGNQLEWKKGAQDVKQNFTKIETKQEKKLIFDLAEMDVPRAALRNNPGSLEWLAGRGICVDTASKLHLGFIQSAQAISPNHPWRDDGWIIFPTTRGKKITCLKYRSIKGKKGPNGESGIIRKSGMETSLYNLDAVTAFEDVFLVEGEPDCLAMTEAGFISVALPSADYQPTPEERETLLRADKIFLAGDSDSVGQSAMSKLWTELRDHTYMLRWPEGMKDANQTLLETCKGDPVRFANLVNELKAKALEQPMPFMSDLTETMYHSDNTSPFDNPARLRFPWPRIDNWTAILPGDVMCMFATESGTGKTTWVMDFLLLNAIKHNKVVVNYSAEVLPVQYARRAVSYLTGVDRNALTAENFTKAAHHMGDAKFYNGYKPGAKWNDVIELLKSAKKTLGADILVVDHLHFLTRSEKDETKAQSEAMRALKDIALEYNVIVVVVGQPRKMQAQHRGREAQMQDAKGSEAFGSDASQVFILHRNRMQGQEGAEVAVFDPITKVTLDKSRESESRSTKLYFRGHICKFEEMAYGNQGAVDG